MAYKGEQSSLQNTEQIGSFSGYVRRPLPTQTGMITQIFGENGEDSDMIVALSLSKYQDLQVVVNIYLIKDANGKIMKEGDSYPLISSFMGFIRRSAPKKDGMMAQFFAPNGAHSDSVSVLSKTDYQDCLVFVDVRGIKALASDSRIQAENKEIIDKNYAHKITRNEKLEFQKKEKQFKKMNEHLNVSEFFNRIEVLLALGTKEDFINWLTEHKTCSHHQDDPCQNESDFTEITQGLLKPFNYLPVCEEHKEAINDFEHFNKNRFYYEMKHRMLLKSWAAYTVREKFSYDGKSEPDPNRVIDWAASKKISHLLPSNYKQVL